ncbi:MAG TPA: hypothetical protein VN774_02595 [Candidatus Limnocylindrales bacterium]|nr:hypothetical protein [Candidatus Limnocylindrales bacterium]
MKIILRILGMVLGLAIGAAAGGYFTYARYAGQFELVRTFATIATSSATSVDEFNQESDNAKKDLLATLSLYEGAGETPNVEVGVRKALRMNSGLIEARLSVLEEKDGNTARSKAYLLKAQDDLKSVGWADLSDETVLQAIKK